VSDEKVTPGTLSDAGIAERIRLMRERRGLTDARLAEASGRTAGGFAAYLSTLTGERRTKPTAEFVWQMSRVLGVRVEWLLTGEGPAEDDLPPDPDQPARRQASIAALLLGLPREAIEQARLQQPTRTLSVGEWFQLIELSAATSKLHE
jgi:transcriptional regulator with XRE-family HTH domain